MATHRRGSAEAKSPGPKVPGATKEATHGQHTAFEVEKVEPAGLPTFGANPITVPSITAIPAAPPVVDPDEVPALDVPEPALPEPALPEPALPEPEVPELEVPELDVPELDVPELDVPELDVPELDEPEAAAPVDFAAVAVPLVVHEDEETSTPHPAHGRNELGLDADIAAHWDLWSAQIGRALMPTLRELGRSMHGFSCAMICTADGFNLCTLGVDEAGVLRLAALTSSMHSMADAVTQAVHSDPERRLDLLTLTDQTSTIVVLAIRDLIIGKLLLWVATEDETLGALLVRSRLAASQVRQLLHVDEP